MLKHIVTVTMQNSDSNLLVETIHELVMKSNCVYY